jgi:autotransporter translocation and assembly factor TamB
MPEIDDQREETQQPRPQDSETPRRRAYFTRRNAAIFGGVLAVVIVFFVLLGIITYRYGVFDPYIKEQFTAKMADIGIVFDAEVFRVTVAPLQLELQNATFKNKVTGELLFSIRNAQLKLTVQDLYAWQLSRDITVDTTDITGAEVWIKFDENGRSNYADLTLVEEEPGRVNFKYDSVVFSVMDSVIHVNDVSHKISGDARDVVFWMHPAGPAIEDPRRYEFDFVATDSRFVYDESPMENISAHVRGIADRNGADISDFRITTPIGETVMNGRVEDWKDLRYRMNVESTVDLTQASNTFPLGATLRGVGNFKGVVSGEGTSYRVEGAANADSFAADGVYLKAVNIEGTVAGTNSNYEANGKAVAELLTFEDFRVEFPQLVGNVRGTGTDFRWVGDLQAVALKTPSMTLGGLFLSDAVAELHDRDLALDASTGRAKQFSAGDTQFTELAARNFRLTRKGGVTEIAATTGSAGSLKSGDLRLNGVSGTSLRVRDTTNTTDVELNNLRSNSGQLKDVRLSGVTAGKFSMTDRGNTSDITLNGLKADRAETGGAVVSGIDANNVTIRDTPAETVIYSDANRVASVNAGGATLGNLNIAGVRLTIRQGTLTGTSNDIDAGNIALAKSKALPEGGNLQNVRIVKPVFVVEPSGRYRASADMSIGGGVLGSIDLGAARADVVYTGDQVALNNFTAAVMNGSASGNAVIALNNRARSDVNATFQNLDLAKLLALGTGRVLPLEGTTTGTVDLTFTGSSFRNATGSINADIAGNAGAATDANRVPISGRVELTAANGLFTVGRADLSSAASRLSATGQFDLARENSNLDVNLNSTNAAEVARIVRVLGISDTLEQQMNSLQADLAGNMTFNGKVTGNFNDPSIEGRASLDTLLLHGRDVGSVTTDIARTPLQLELRNGMLRDRDGGTVAFSLTAPTGGQNNTSVNATLTNVNAGNLLAALPITLPERIRDFTGQTSGTVNLTGLPNNAGGEINIASTAGTIGGQAFDSLTAKAVFSGTRIDLQTAEIRVGQGSVSATGTYDRASTEFNFDVTGKTVPVPLALTFLPRSDAIPTITGTADFTAKATGVYDRPSSYNVNFNGTAQNVVINDNPFGTVTFNGNTVNQLLTANLTATVEGRPQQINATVNFADDNLPFRLEQRLDQSPIGPYIAFIPALKNLAITGTATGVVEVTGNLSQLDASGNRSITYQGLTGTARFTQLALMIQDSPLSAAEPVSIRFSPREIVFESARFSGGGSNMTIAGTKALAEDAVEDLTINGRVNLALANLVFKDTDAFFGGFANVSVRYTGPKLSAQLVGTADLDNGSLATFIGNDRVSFERIKGRLIFTANNAQIENATGFLGGGRFTASGGALLDGLSLQAFRLSIDGNNVTVPLPQDFITTGDAVLEIAGRREPDSKGPMGVAITGRVAAKRSIYSKDIDLSSIVGARRDQSLSFGGNTFGNVRFDVTIEGRDALIVRNNIADLTASVSLRVAGDAENPQVTGRITANGGTILFRKDRYQIQRGVLEFPPETYIEPVINLQAETEIAGYQIFVNLSGPLTDTESLNATVRSSPALPQNDVVSLITTGSLSNTATGIPTLAQTGINTAADILTDAIISNPARKATDKLFGLNVFEIDPIISGERAANPGARLTVGRQINNNLRVTYSTNLSQDQNQVLALEYRVTDKLSFVAQYEQRSLSNVTRNRDNFSFEIRFRRRF